MKNQIIHVYDKTFKKILTLSSGAVINLINGLFETNYPVSSKITYNWTEFEDTRLRKILADTIITINGTVSYHIEAQMTNDETIVMRMFEYGFQQALRTAQPASDTGWRITFPEPKVICFYSNDTIPDEYPLLLDFGKQGTFEYKVSAFKFPEMSIEELNKRKMIILVPFMLLKLRKSIERSRTPENLDALKNLIQHDIIGSIKNNLKLGNITNSDALQLINYSQILYSNLYAKYDETEEITQMTDESYITEADILVQILENAEADLIEKNKLLDAINETLVEKNKVLDETNKILNEKNKTLDETSKSLNETNKILNEKSKTLDETSKALDEANDTLAQKELLISQQSAEIECLKKQLALLQSK